MNYNKQFTMIIRFMLIAFSLATCNISSAKDTQENLSTALLKAKVLLERYNKQASRLEQSKFLQYLNYYRAEGHYQAVSPAPYPLRESLSEDSKTLFKDLITIAKDLTRERKPIPGASSLSKEGEQFYQTIIKNLKAAKMKRTTQ